MLISCFTPADLYCAKLAKMYPEDPLAAAFTDMVVCQATDCFEPLLATMGIKDPEAKMTARVDLVKATGTVGARMNSLGAYLVGESNLSSSCYSAND